MRTRFAPSPTGYLHLGHALSALLNHTIGDGFLLRIEDIDKSRVREHFQPSIIKDLQWLGCVFKGKIIQQQPRLAIYQRYLGMLIEEQWVYPCFCSRKDVNLQTSGVTTLNEEQKKKRTYWQIDQPIYTGFCKKQAPSSPQITTQPHKKPHCWRLDAERVCATFPALSFTDITLGFHRVDMTLWGDVVLARIDADQQLHVSYHLASVIDDALQQIEMIIRGKDLLASTIIHCALQRIFSWQPPIYFHHDLIKNEKGCKLSKRDHATSLASLRENGTSLHEIRMLLSPILERNLDYYKTYTRTKRLEN